MTQITFAELLELLGHTEHTSLCHKPVGGQFTTLVNTPTVLPMIVERLPDSDVVRHQPHNRARPYRR